MRKSSTSRLIGIIAPVMVLLGLVCILGAALAASRAMEVCGLFIPSRETARTMPLLHRRMFAQ